MVDTISPLVLERISLADFQSKARLLRALKSASSAFRIMDLPPELRQLVWAFANNSWNMDMFYFEGWFHFPRLLRVSGEICREASQSIVLKLYMDEIQLENTQRCFENLGKKFSSFENPCFRYIIDNLQRLVIIARIGRGRREKKLTFAIDRSHDLALEKSQMYQCWDEQRYELEKDAKIVPDIQRSITALMSNEAESSRKGLNLIEAVIATQTIWGKLIDTWQKKFATVAEEEAVKQYKMRAHFEEVLKRRQLLRRVNHRQIHGARRDETAHG
jgi:hypothetical protein